MKDPVGAYALPSAAGHASPASVGALLKQHRLRARLTQVELADLSTVSLRTIRNLEAGRGQNPRPETLRLLADGLRLGPCAFETLNDALGKGSRGASLNAYVSQPPTGTQLAAGHLVGRQAEVNSALEAIRSGSARVITLAGFGGVGKSRLAFGIVQAAKVKFSMDWLWVPASAPVSEGDGSVAARAGNGPADRFARWAGEFLAGTEAAKDDFVALAAAQPFVLVLDDLRQYGAQFDSLLTEVLQRCPRLAIVETTRQMIDQTNRVLMPVKPLALEGSVETGTGQGSGGGSALELLLSHARTVCPDLGRAESQFDSLNAICAALDGLPRAIENSASWLAFCSPGQVAEMTASDPFAVGCCASPADDCAHWGYDALADAINCLPPTEYTWLERLSAASGAWTLKEAGSMVQRDPLETAKSIYGPLALGLIRPVRTCEGEPRTFTVLNHVKSFLA
jgi:transcriptional regulator with XRE-family HTH domain